MSNIFCGKSYCLRAKTKRINGNVCTFQGLCMEKFNISSEFMAKFPNTIGENKEPYFLSCLLLLGNTPLFLFSIIPIQITILRHAVNMGQKACPL